MNIDDKEEFQHTYYPNFSPWLDELTQWQPRPTLTGEHKTDVVIIGGGIAGVATAYAFLKHTNKSVLLIEADSIASGASGHNAGQAVAMMETYYTDLADTFGRAEVEKAALFMEQSWKELSELCAYADVEPFETDGLDGLMTVKEIRDAIRTEQFRQEMGLRPDTIYIDELIEDDFIDASWIVRIPKKEIASMLDVVDDRFIAVSSQKRTVVNPAQLCRDVVEKLEEEHPDRFELAERSPVTAIMCDDTTARVVTENGLAHTEYVVYCTNGYSLPNTTYNGTAVALPEVRPLMGYMVGLLDSEHKDVTAVSYAHEKNLDPQVDATSYFYLTRRPLQDNDIITIGGLDYSLKTHETYNVTDPVEAEIVNSYEEWIKKHRPDLEHVPLEYQWHGLMGYTKNGTRIIGAHPDHAQLLFNIGCNGIGLLQSVMSANALARELMGETDAIPELFRLRKELLS